LNSLEIHSHRKSPLLDKGAKVIYGPSRYNKLLGYKNMSIEEIEYMLSLLGSFGIGAVIFGTIVFLIIKNYLPTYLNEKAKNLAKIEDIEGITRKIEDVKHEYMSQIQGLSHQNSLILEQARGQHQLRLAALDKRLQAHQEAYALWREKKHKWGQVFDL
jgi:hypothetical protein